MNPEKRRQRARAKQGTGRAHHRGGHRHQHIGHPGMTVNLPAPTPGPGEFEVCYPAYAPLDNEMVYEARQVTHDSLIAQLGPHRRSGIWWTEHRGVEVAIALDAMRASSPIPEHIDAANELSARAAEYPDGVLIIAHALAVEPG